MMMMMMMLLMMMMMMMMMRYDDDDDGDDDGDDGDEGQPKNRKHMNRSRFSDGLAYCRLQLRQVPSATSSAPSTATPKEYGAA